MPTLVMQPRRARVAALLLLSIFVAGAATILAVGGGIWRVERGGCWPWEEPSSYAGGEFCDGHPNKYPTD